MRRPAALLALSSCALWSGPAAADENDLVMSRLATVVRDDQGGAIDAVGDNQAFRSLASELGVVLAPRLNEPADTLGFGGFALTADLAVTQISGEAAYWRALEGAPGTGGDPTGPGQLTTASVFAKKGIWLPLPSFELGLGAVHILRSSMWAAQAYAKGALREGYHDDPWPSVALRAGISRMMGQSDFNLTVGSIDALVSKDFGVAGTFRLSPYVGWSWLLILARSELIDATPDIDSLAAPTDQAADFVFVDQDVIHRDRFVAGAKLTYSVITVGLELALARAGWSSDDRASAMPCDVAGAPTADCDAADGANRQTSVTATVGTEF